MTYYSIFARFCLGFMVLLPSSLVVQASEVGTAEVTVPFTQESGEEPAGSEKPPLPNDDNRVSDGVSTESDLESSVDSKDVLIPAEPAFSQENKVDGPSLMQEGIKTIVMLFILLVGFWWFSNWLKKTGKLARISGSNGAIECLSVYSVGQKEKIALIKVKDQEILVGITQHSIQQLHHFKQESLAQLESIEDKDAPSDAEFSKLMDKAATDS